MELDSIINNRYRLITLIGRGNASNTYKAKDLIENTHVAIKIISLKRAEDWKTLELLKKEAEILAGLNDSHIPKYLDYFEIDTQSDRYFCLVRELIEGISLAELVKSNHPLNIHNILQIAGSLLEILVYLQKFNPPVIHRDLKPENVLRTYDGSIYLIDFGAAKNNYPNSNSFLNIFIGTLGYIPPEQYYGKTSTASDLYSVGCIILFLLTRRCPTNLPFNELKIDFKSTVKLSSETSDWLEKMLEPSLENRFSSARVALNKLSKLKSFEFQPTFLQTMESIVKGYQYQESKPQSKTPSLNTIQKNVKSSILLKQQSNTLWIDCPDAGYFQPKKLEINNDNFILYVGNSHFHHPIQGNNADLSVSLIKKQLGQKDTQHICCAIYDGNTFHRFGSTLGYAEQLRLVKSIDEFITNCLNSN